MPAPQKPDRFRRALRWLLPAAVLALAPKCLLCVLTYAGLATVFGLAGPEICGATDGVSWTDAFACLGAATAISVVAVVIVRRRHRRSLRSA